MLAYARVCMVLSVGDIDQVKITVYGYKYKCVCI